MQIKECINWINQTLSPHLFKDYAPNGLQIEGNPEIRHIVTGVTASLDLIQKAIQIGADTILVHHGYFWKNENSVITGRKAERIRLIMKHDLNLIAYHLPLDAHPLIGNNAQLAKKLNIEVTGQVGEQNLIWMGQLSQPCQLSYFASNITTSLNRQPLVIGDPNQTIQNIAWCTGGGQGFFETAIELGVDAFITGEASEPCFHAANESGVAFIAAGHHATERYGIQALGQALNAEFGITSDFIDLKNPI